MKPVSVMTRIRKWFSADRANVKRELNALKHLAQPMTTKKARADSRELLLKSGDLRSSAKRYQAEADMAAMKRLAVARNGDRQLIDGLLKNEMKNKKDANQVLKDANKVRRRGAILRLYARKK